MEVVADSALVTSGATTEVTTEVTTTDVNVATPKIAEVSTNTYVLSTGGVYSGNIHNGVPTWLTDAIIAQVTAGTLNISQLVNDLYVLVQSIELGVNQSIASVQNEVVSQSQYLTTVKSELQGDIAAAIEQYDTIVSPELAKAVKTDALGVIKDQVEAWALDVTDVYASNNLASATQVELLTSTLTDVNTGTVATATKLYDGYTTIGITPDGTGIASAGYLDTLSASVNDVNTGIAATATKLSEGYTTIGITPDGTGIASAGYLDTLSASVNEVSVALTTVERAAVEANAWSASSSKLITGPDGSITGWGFSDGSNAVSNFQIKATNFSISDGLTGHTPFSIVGSDVNFNGKVTFSSISDSGTYIPTISSVAAAQTEAADAKANAIAALTQLTDIASDSVLDPGEKTLVRKEWEILVTEQVLIADQAAGLAVSAIGYREALEYLGTYLNAGVAWLVSNPIVPTWLADVNLTTNTPINRSAFRGSFRMYYSERQLILNAISTKLKEIADSKVLPADVATAINTNITTIDGGKITTDAVFANRVFAENITATGTITGACINGSTITGARINGGTITSTDFVGSTIRVRDLQVVTDAGYSTVAIGTLFFTNTLPIYNEMVSYTNLYAYNATSVVSTYGTPIRAASSLIGTSISIYSPILLCILTSYRGTPNAIYVAIYIGSTLLGTGRINGRGGEVAGITFSRTTSYSRNNGDYTDSVYIRSFTGAFTLSGEGSLKVVIRSVYATIQPANVTDNRALLSNL